jgi:hypothetical protein
MFHSHVHTCSAILANAGNNLQIQYCCLPGALVYCITLPTVRSQKTITFIVPTGRTSKLASHTQFLKLSTAVMLPPFRLPAHRHKLPISRLPLQYQILEPCQYIWWAEKPPHLMYLKLAISWAQWVATQSARISHSKNSYFRVEKESETPEH